jgi:hypothetical protein
MTAAPALSRIFTPTPRPRPRVPPAPRRYDDTDASLELESVGRALKVRDTYDGVTFPA